MDFIKELKAIVGSDFVLTDKEQVLPYIKDASYLGGSEPLAVALPGNTQEISRILKLCNDNKVPVYTRGSGTSLTGSSVPLGGIVLSTSRLDKILEVNIKDRYVIAEAGVRLNDLNSYLAKLNYMYPPDPASDVAASVGGSLSTNAGGVRGAKYGATKEWVLGMEVVLPDGTITWFGEKTLKRSAGYDLAALLIGSEGTLAIITKAILKIAPTPKRDAMLLVFYDSYRRLGDAISMLNQNGIIPLTAEFLDQISMDSVRSYGIPYPDKASCMLLIITSESTEETIKTVRETSPLEIRVFRDQLEIDAVLKLRKGLYSSLLLQRQNPGQKVILGDIVVPPSRISETLDDIYGAIERSDMKVAVFGHIGDGNVHLNIFTNADRLQDAESLLMETAEIAVNHDGCVSAEHGIGLEKRDLLVQEHRARNTNINLELMKKLKVVFDPNNIMNRGKLFE